MTSFISPRRLRPAPLTRSARQCFAGAMLPVFGALGVAAVAPLIETRSDEPPPRVVTPAPLPDSSAPPPSDAIVLFDGSSLDAWRSEAHQPPAWRIDHEHAHALTITPGTGGIFSRQSFGDAQIHLEFATPDPAVGEGQARGNSGLYIQGRYEVQILDSFDNATYPNGQCAAIYAQHAPLVNASLPPGRWQSYDIIFRAPTFDDAGTRTAPARITVFHNGVLVHDHAPIDGPTTAAPLSEAPADGPIFLQDHGNPVRFRNIWVRPLTK